jgi:negative regulator of sigma E activity
METFMTDVTEPNNPKGKTALTESFREHFSGDAPLTEKAKSFAKARPWTSAAFVGIAAMAVLNTLRGVRK